jgi:hypothetical protein
MNVDYNHLDPTKIYLRRDPVVREESILNTVTHWTGVPITQMVLDEFLFNMPEYKEAVDSLFSCYKFFDKNMFIMPKLHFLNYMKYLQKWYRICLNPFLWQTVLQWIIQRSDEQLNCFVNRRGIAFLLEMASAIHFEYLFLNHYPIIITTPTEDSFNEY